MDEIRSGSIVRAVGNFMLRLAAGLLSVLMARFGAHPASAKQRNLVVVDLVAVPIVPTSQQKCEAKMGENGPICNCCKSSRVRDGHPPRELVKLPIEITQSEVFNNRGIPVFLCEVCDEHELTLALAEHEKRIDNK